MASNGSNFRPVIGLTTYLERSQCGVWDTPAAFLPKAYFAAVNAAGGIAVLIPPQPVNSHTAERIIDSLDGLIICGGKDIDPNRYGHVAHATTDEPRRDRDELEDALLTAAISRQLPFLGICRGAQMLNVHQGGTLIQHLPEVVGDDRYQKGGGQFTRISVEIEHDTLLSRVLQGANSIEGDMYHHQAIDEIGRDLKVSAATRDNVIEAIELTSVPFGLGVQWHPEQSPEDTQLFTGLIQAATQYAETRSHE